MDQVRSWKPEARSYSPLASVIFFCSALGPHPQRHDASPPSLRSGARGVIFNFYGSSLTQMLRKLIGSLLSPWAWSLIGAPSKAL